MTNRERNRNIDKGQKREIERETLKETKKDRLVHIKLGR